MLVSFASSMRTILRVSKSCVPLKFRFYPPSGGATSIEYCKMVSKLTMKTLALLVPIIFACAIALSSCTTVVKEPATTTTTTRTESAVTRTPTSTSTTVTRQTSSGY